MNKILMTLIVPSYGIEKNLFKASMKSISKVLENTLDQASTVVGTPYYMSPEVCENKPYTFKSETK